MDHGIFGLNMLHLSYNQNLLYILVYMMVVLLNNRLYTNIQPVHLFLGIGCLVHMEMDNMDLHLLLESHLLNKNAL